MNYKVLHKSETQEIRQYEPHRRTVSICGRFYFLQFPYVIFIRNINLRGTCSLNVLFADHDLSNDEQPIVYHVALPNVSHIACLDRVGHYTQMGFKTFEHLMLKFWSYDFSAVGAWGLSQGVLDKIFRGSYNEWQKMSLDEILENMKNQTADRYLVYDLQSLKR